MFKNATLSTKLMGGFGIVLALLMVVMAIYQFSVISTNNGFKNLMQTEVEITTRAANAEILMLQSRRNEKDFLLRLDKKYEDRLKKTVAGLKKEAQAIAELAEQSENSEMATQAVSIVKYADNYAEAFAGIVAAWKRKGLDQESGLRGKFRNAAHALAEDIPAHAVDDLRIAMLQMRRYEKDYLQTKSDKYKQKFTAAINTFGSLLEKSKCDQTARASQQAALVSYRKAFNDYVTADKSSEQQDQAYQTMRTAAHQMEEALDSVNVHETKALLLGIRKNEKDYLLRGDEKYIKKTHAAIEKMLGAFRGAGILQTHVVDTEKLLKSYQEAFDSLVAEDGKIVALMATMRDAVHKIEPVVENLTQTSKTAAEAMSQKTIETANGNAKTAMTVGIAALILGLCLAFFIMRSITKPINLIINDLNDGSDQVASASGQISSASQQLAEGSSEQAASIEETSSSLEEMSSMTKQNADNASQADNLMKDANQIVAQANQSMDELTGSMAEISKASEETSKIIKTIDEIAFQTNLLALNAAVEAARAGEAGAGFAVVADEVRNLAMRAAEAAKSTSDLIEGTVKKINDGSALVTRTNDAFTQVAGSAAKVGGLVSEIAAASNEQAQGIEQVNTAVTEMDQVTQATAGNAEETAGASEELSAQAEQMKSVVARLVALVGSQGKGTKRKSVLAAGDSNLKTYMPLSNNASPGMAKHHHTLPRGPEVSPEQVIPMDDEVFKDF